MAKKKTAALPIEDIPPPAINWMQLTLGIRVDINNSRRKENRYCAEFKDMEGDDSMPEMLRLFGFGATEKEAIGDLILRYYTVFPVTRVRTITEADKPQPL